MKTSPANASDMSSQEAKHISCTDLQYFLCFLWHKIGQKRCS